MAEKKSTVKKRNWAFLVYPDSAPTNWREMLRETGLQCAISPLHDKDINADGTPKKPHYHVIVVYSGPTSFNVVNALCASLNAPIPKALESVRGMYRYLIHLDNPEKFQYSEKEIFLINGFDISDYVEMSKSEVNSYKKKIISLIRDIDIVEYSDLMDFLLDSDMSVEFDVASSHTIFFNNYLRSRKFSIMSTGDKERNE